MGELEQLAFGLLAQAHPREAYDLDAERFWKFFQRECPDVSRETMERLLSEGINQ